MGHRRDPETIAALGLLGVGAAITVLVHVPRTRAAVQRLDDRWYGLVQASRSTLLTAAAKTLDVGFGTTIDWTVRVAVTARLVRRRRWAALTAWAATIVLGEASVGPLKAFVDRIRPPDPRTTTSMMSYPSGHALAAATTAPGIVLALVPPGPARRRALAVAVPLAGATALSRTYLNAHWLSDVLGGFALGTGYALAAPRAVRRLRRRALKPLPDDHRRADHGVRRYPSTSRAGWRCRSVGSPLRAARCGSVRRSRPDRSPALGDRATTAEGAAMRPRSRRSRRSIRSSTTPATARAATAVGATAVGATSTGFTAVIAAAAGAAAVGALAIGALAVGRLRIGDAAVKKLRIGRLEVDELTVRRQHVLEQD